MTSGRWGDRLVTTTSSVPLTGVCWLAPRHTAIPGTVLYLLQLCRWKAMEVRGRVPDAGCDCGARDKNRLLVGYLATMPEKLARLFCRIRLHSSQLRLKLFRLAGGSPKLDGGTSVLLSPASVRCRQLGPQPRCLRRVGPHTTRHDTTRHDTNASPQWESRNRCCTAHLCPRNVDGSYANATPSGKKPSPNPNAASTLSAVVQSKHHALS